MVSIYVEVVRENVGDAWHTCVAPFVVLGDPAAGPRPSVAVVFASATSWAYEGWGGRSTYGSYFNFNENPQGRTHLASMLRPNINGDGRGLIRYDLPWVRFITENNRTVDYLTMEDIHKGGLSLLQNYRELVFIGHSEYWSGRSDRRSKHSSLAEAMSSFPAATSASAVSRSADGKTLIAYKADDSGAAAYPAPNNDTWQWNWAPINNPANSMTGVNWEINGVGMLGAPGSAWMVRDASVAWIFAGTGLSNGNLMGGSRLAGDEVDGDSLVWTGAPGAPGSVPSISSWSIQQGTDPSYHIFATCEAHDISGPSHMDHPMFGVAGFYQRAGQGMVVTIPQESVGQELWPLEASYGGRLPVANDTLLARVVLNILDHLASPLTELPLRDAGGRGAPSTGDGAHTEPAAPGHE